MEENISAESNDNQTVIDETVDNNKPKRAKSESSEPAPVAEVADAAPAAETASPAPATEPAEPVSDDAAPRTLKLNKADPADTGTEDPAPSVDSGAQAADQDEQGESNEGQSGEGQSGDGQNSGGRRGRGRRQRRRDPNTPSANPLSLTELKNKSTQDLIDMAREMGLENMARSRKQDIIFALLKRHAKSGEDIWGDGVLEILQDGFGFLRSADSSYLAPR